MENDLQVVIDKPVFDKIDYWIQKADGEVSGLGKVFYDKGIYRVKSAILLKQKNSAVDTDLDPADIAKAMYETKDEPGYLNFWWHSHVEMDTSWSKTDTDTMALIARAGWFVCTVLNKRREKRSALYVGEKAPLPSMFIDEIPTRITQYLPKKLTEEWDKEFDEKCEDELEFPEYGEIGNWGNGKKKEQEPQETLQGLEKTQSTQEEGYRSKYPDSLGTPASSDETWDSETIEHFIESMVDDMEQQLDPKLARSELSDIVSLLAKTRLLTLIKKAEIKEDAIERYNISRADLGALSGNYQ